MIDSTMEPEGRNGRVRINFVMILSILASVLGMFQFGINTGAINAPQKVLEDFISEIYLIRYDEPISATYKDWLWSIIVSIFAIGGMAGGFAGPWIGQKFGRKNGLLYSAMVGVVAVTIMSFSKLMASYETLVIGRIFIGFNCGANTALVSMYLLEISPKNIRGSISLISQLAVVTGILLSQIIGIEQVLGSKERWPFLFATAYLPLIMQFILLPICPESPRYLLLEKKQELEARMVLIRLRSTDNVQEEIEEMFQEARREEQETQMYGKVNSIMDLIKHPWLRQPLIISVVLQLSQQLSGINAVFYYSTDIFLTAGLTPEYAGYATASVGIILIIGTLLSVYLIDRLGRRTLQLAGLSGMFLMSLLLTFSFLTSNLISWIKYTSIIFVLLYVISFAIGPGAIPWMMTNELFTQGSRGIAVSVAVFVNWSANFLVGITFPAVKNLLQNFSFVPFAVLTAIIIAYLYKKMPETKNRTFEEISSIFRKLNDNTTSHNGYGSSDIVNPIVSKINEEQM